MIMSARIEIPNEALFVRIARNYAVEPLRQLDVAEDDISRVETIISEACTNVVQHGWKERRHLYQVNLTYHADKIEITVVDSGVGFDVRKISKPLPQGGFGIFLIHKTSDKHRFSCSGGKTKVYAEINLHYHSSESRKYAESIDTTYPSTSC